MNEENCEKLLEMYIKQFENIVVNEKSDKFSEIQYLKFILEEMNKRINIIYCKEKLISFLSYYYGELLKLNKDSNNSQNITLDYLNKFLELNSKNIKFGHYSINVEEFNASDYEKLSNAFKFYANKGDTSGLEDIFSGIVLNKLEKNPLS